MGTQELGGWRVILRRRNSHMLYCVPSQDVETILARHAIATRNAIQSPALYGSPMTREARPHIDSTPTIPTVTPTTTPTRTPTTTYIAVANEKILKIKRTETRTEFP